MVLLRRVFGLGMLGFLVVLGDPAAADWRRVQGGLRLDGPLDEAFHGAFLHSFWSAALSEKRGQPIGIWLNSSGGTLDEALRVGQVIRDLQADGTRIATLVAGNGHCDLPCLVIFALGQERYVEDGARIRIDLAAQLKENPELMTGPLVSILAEADAQFAAAVLSQDADRQALSGTELATDFPQFTRRLR
ncbi:hypothetical protein KMP13_15425 [Epibacterium ulvae]|uniref:hypothetical protein n=1 Tax=Epibacterium ulvae TaxID=1156985 RepID=UPI001BFC3751|nr:hypothetical protein [Epibacterium ulvae]MBT8155231.1 hypothetical protein [Epibacterium ulvae]